MKRVIVIFILIVSTLCSFALEIKKVAILEVVDRENKLSYHQKLMLRSSLAEEVNKAVGFEAYDRSNVDAIMSEHDFQRTGLVSSEQIRQLGEMAGASYILVIEGAVSTQGNLFVSASLLDVETGQMAVNANENMATSETGMQNGCASLSYKLFSKLKEITVTSVKEEERLSQEYYVSKKNKEYIYMGRTMPPKIYAKFLETNCSEAYKQYKSGCTLKKIGWAFFGVGMGITIGGASVYAVTEIQSYGGSRLNPDSPEHQKYLDQYNRKIALGAVGMGIGGALVVTSIPLICVGSVKQKKSILIYNEQCSSSSIPPLTFNFTAGHNGLGLAMIF